MNRRNQRPLLYEGEVEALRKIKKPVRPGVVSLLSALFMAAILVVLGKAGVFNDLFAGPRLPLPRGAAGFSLGMDIGDFLAKYPALSKAFHDYNGDPRFKVVAVGQPAGKGGPSSVDLVFFQGKLFDVAASWESDKTAPPSLWEIAHQYRRWVQSGGVPKAMGKDVKLSEWYLKDSATEMVLRDLTYPQLTQGWEEIRDSLNKDAQTAFAKYRNQIAG